MTTVKVNELSVLTIYVANLERSAHFYREHLGFEKVQDMEPGILIRSGEATLYLEETRDPVSAGKESSAGFCPCFGTESVKKSYGALKEAGIPMASNYAEFGPNFALFRIFDPDGNLIEFAGNP